MDVLLIHPSRKIAGKKDLLYRPELLTPSLGLAAVSAYCRKNNIDCRIIDLRLPHHTTKEVIDFIKDRKPALVNITAFTDEIVSAGKLAASIKTGSPETKISIGGPHSSALPKETLKEFSGFDFVIVGEGEKTLVELVNTLKSNNQEALLNLKGIALRKHNETVLLPPQPEIEDLDALPYPAWDLFELASYSNFLMVNASRGCPYRCYFCNPNYLGRPRLRKAAKVADEVEHLIKRFGISEIQFVDATMGISRDFTSALCDELIRRGLNENIKWLCETRADKLDRALLQKMKKAGCRLISLGAESGNETILSEVIHKSEAKIDIVKAVSAAKVVGIKIRCFFTFGHAGETQREVKETIKFALELNSDMVSFGLAVPYPGTELRKMAEKGVKGMRVLHNRWDEYNQLQFSCYETRDLSLKELKRWQARAYLSFYSRHPLKAFDLVSGTWGYTPTAIFKIFAKLLSRL